MVLSSWSAADLNIYIRKAMSACNTEEEDQDSDYPDLVLDSENEDDERNKEEGDKGEAKEFEDENGSASYKDASLLSGNCLFTGLILYSLIPIYCIHWFRFIFAVEEAIDSDEIQFDRFDKDGFHWSGPTVRIRQLPALVLGDPNSKFGMFYTNQGAEWENKLLRDRMQRHSLKVTCQMEEEYDIAMAHTSRFGITVIT